MAKMNILLPLNLMKTNIKSNTSYIQPRFGDHLY
jgi:hypothetical protein